MGGKIYSADVFGNQIEVQCKVTRGLPNVQIVGLASKALDESKERIRAAFHSAKIDFPKSRVLVNLSPADLPKDGSSYDIPIALAILQAAEMIRPLKSDVFACGEIGLDGQVLPVRGIIGRLRSKNHADYAAYLVPKPNIRQVKMLNLPNAYAIASLSELLDIFSNPSNYHPVDTNILTSTILAEDNTYDEVKGQSIAKRAIEIAAAGRHNILLHGPPGTGKSMLAKALGSILPDLNTEESLDATHLHSLRHSDPDILISRPPVRAPHHSASDVAILGGGQRARPGEISLAHNGVLFLDELPEFSRACIEALRQPLEDHEISISRAEQTYTYPASFILIATMNPCPCGNLGSNKVCTCSANSINQYQKKLSGPILDRIDLFVKVEEVSPATLLTNPNTAESSKIRKNVLSARERQAKRNDGRLNGTLTNPMIRNLKLEPDAKELLDSATDRLKLSPRSYFRVLRVAQTIADLDNSESITLPAIAEAIQYRENIPSLS